MPAFFSDVLDEIVTPVFLERVQRKFHFAETQMIELQTVAEQMTPLMRSEAAWERKAYPMPKRHRINEHDQIYESVVMTLGSGIDRLQERYCKRELFLSSYIVEVLSGEILMRGYDAYNQYVRKETGRHAAGYHFLGSEAAFPLDLLPELLRECSLQITCNSAFCMQPNKSVAFVAELTQDENMYCRSICQGCNHTHCSHRC